MNLSGVKFRENGEADLDQVMERLDLIGKSRAATSWIHPEGDGEVALDEICPITGLPLYSDPGSNDLDLWLHAYKYEADDKSWSYKTEYPEWALEPSRKFMKMAIEEAEKCGETQTQFNVGCVLVHNGQVISTGHSRELPVILMQNNVLWRSIFRKMVGKEKSCGNRNIYLWSLVR